MLEKRVITAHCPTCNKEFHDVVSLRPLPVLAGPPSASRRPLRTVLVRHRECDTYVRVILENHGEKESEQSVATSDQSAVRDGELASTRDVVLVDIAKNQVKGVFEFLNDGAKQLVTACSFLLAAYAFLFESFVDAESLRPMDRTLHILPPIALLGSLLVSLFVVQYPWKYEVVMDAPEQAEEFIRKTRTRKLWGLWISALLLVAGFGLVIWAISRRP